jgi:gliding motility-associated-like protein
MMASHIVGAELFYDYVGGTTYKVTLKLYRNCGCVSDSCAEYNDPEFIQFFDASGSFFKAIPIQLPPRDTLPLTYSNPCLRPNQICVEQAFFIDTVSLPPISGGFTMVYQRCCRNKDIQSIPQSTGSTYIAHIPTDSLATNSSPRFKEKPAVFICQNKFWVFDHSAIDPDGDSLSYELVNALDGANAFCPNPIPGGCALHASPPPYTSVPYITPFGANNPTNNPSNGKNLIIDSITGVVTGTPSNVGLFILAVAVHEWRNGVLIGTTIRDYQLNIVPCDAPNIDINYIGNRVLPGKNYGVYTVNCNNYKVNFNNYSSKPAPGSTKPLTYEWDFGETAYTTDTSSLPTPAYTYHDTGTYLVKVIVSQQNLNLNCHDTGYALIKIYPLVTSDFTVASGCLDSLVVGTDLSTSTSQPLSAWSWNWGDGRVSNIQNATHKYTLPGDYTIKLTVTNPVGCVSVKTDTIHVKAIPKPDFKVTKACIFDTVQYTYTGTGDGVASYDWDLTTAQTSTLPNPKAYYTSNGIKIVKLTVIGIEGCPESITKNVIINPLPIPTIFPSPSSNICKYDTANLIAGGGVSYVWHEGRTLDDSTIFNPKAYPTVTTRYIVTVTDANTCHDTISTLVVVLDLPPVDAGLDTSVCLSPGSFRDSVKLQASGAISYVWTPTTGLSNPSISNPTCRPLVNTTYYVKGTDANGCHAIDSVRVYFLDPKLNLIVDTTKPICRYDTTTLRVLDQGLITTYRWTPSIGISNDTVYSPFFYPSFTTTYVLQIANYCYTKSDTATVFVHQLPIVATQKLDSVCIGDSVQLRASGALTYLWRYSPTLSDTLIADPYAFPKTATWYLVTGTDTFGCKNKDSVKVLVYKPPTTFIKPDTAYICLGASVMLNAYGGVRYIWTADPTLSSTTIRTPIATPIDTHWYYVQIYNIHNCYHNDSIKINVQLPITPRVDSTHYDVCPRALVYLHASGGLYYSWSPTQWLSNPQIANPYLRPDSTIIYTVRVSNDCFFADAYDTIIVHPNPTVDAGNDTTIDRGTHALLAGTSNGISYYWYPGLHIDYPFALSSLYAPIDTLNRLLLYAVSDFGCTVHDSVYIRVVANTQLLIPSAFSPNGDGINDLFRIVRHLNIDKLDEFSIYNRWGEKVFTTSDFDTGWDGSYQGQPAPMSVYAWYVKAKTYEDKDVFVKGNVTLVR